MTGYELGTVIVVAIAAIAIFWIYKAYAPDPDRKEREEAKRKYDAEQAEANRRFKEAAEIRQAAEEAAARDHEAREKEKEHGFILEMARLGYVQKAARLEEKHEEDEDSYGPRKETHTTWQLAWVKDDATARALLEP